MGRLARLRAEEYQIYVVERRLAGKPVCTCPLDWFPRRVRFWARKATQEEVQRSGESHSMECEMRTWFEEGGPEG